MVPIDEPIDVLEFHERTYDELRALVRRKEPFITLLGERGMGKPSLMKKLVHDHFGIYIDLKQYSNKKNLRRSYFMDQVLDQLKHSENLSTNKPEFLTREIFNIYFSDKDDSQKIELANLFHSLDEWAISQDQKFILAIDDATMLSKFQHLNFEDLFAFIIDNCKNTSIILSAENEKTIRDVCHLDDLDAPLFGRVYLKVNLAPIPFEKMYDSLNKLFTSFNLKFNNSALVQLIEKTSHTFDNVSLFANELQNFPKIDTRVINSLFEKQSKIQHEKFEQFLSNRVARNKYEKIIAFLSKQESSWTKIKDFLELEIGEKLYDKNFSELLTHLEKNGFIEHDSGLYKVKNAFLSYYYTHNDSKTTGSIGTTSY